MVVLMLSYFIRVMDPNSSLGKICLGENVVVISSDKVEGSGDWNSPEFQDTANSRQKKETKAMLFSIVTSMCCDDAYHVTSRDSALAGCDRLVSEPLVIENYLISEDPEEEPIEEEPLEEPNEEGYDKIQKNDLWLLSMFDARHQNGYENVAWVIAKWMKRKGAGTQKESQFCCDLDIITLRDLIDSEGKLILEDPQVGVPRVGIPRPPRASMQDLYDMMGRMEIRQDAIERMEYRELIRLI
ncbi:hypothetical protein Tco_0622599, partial [Tanacetum coccineum]